MLFLVLLSDDKKDNGIVDWKWKEIFWICTSISWIAVTGGQTDGWMETDGRRTLCITSLTALPINHAKDFVRLTEHCRRYLSHFSQNREYVSECSNLYIPIVFNPFTSTVAICVHL